ncbi:hypothetical protein X777_16514 [Ooceraea biroi]|uniref:Uncharacterized protein n=1 Tax=Ooceraea biroi TaxID=2015173 RepID=A0A026WX49_OOCBI|nr:hypothetical protein X777_16514 [Ooceraea biroi]
MHYWSVENPRWLRQVERQRPWSLNVWCGVLHNRIIGPFFIDGTLNGQKYADFLSQQLPNLLEEVPLETRLQMWYQHDGCPAHNWGMLKNTVYNDVPTTQENIVQLSKRDEYNSKDQDQAGIALCALGEAMSELLKPDIQRSLVPEARSAVLKINEGAKILADLFYRLSISRRAQIVPTLNILAKNTAENIPPDECLFGTSFGEELKKATTMAKSAKDLVKAPLLVSRKVQQPIKPQLHVAPPTASTGNSRAPATTRTSATRRSGAPSNNRRAPYRARSRSRRR